MRPACGTLAGALKAGVVRRQHATLLQVEGTIPQRYAGRAKWFKRLSRSGEDSSD
jgi:hypothetical protein